MPCSKTNHNFSLIFCFFSTYNSFIATAVLCWKHYKIVLSEEHGFSKTQLTVSKTHFLLTHFFAHKKKVSFLVLGNFRWNHCFIFFLVSLFWSKETFWSKQIVCAKMRFSSPFLTQIASGNFLQQKRSIFSFSHFLMTTLKKHYFWRFFAFVHILCVCVCVFFFLFCFSCSNIEKTKNAFFFSRTSFLTSWQCCENTILAQIDTICVYNFLAHPKKHFQMGKTVKIELGPVFNLQLGPMFNLQTPKSWTIFNSTASN